MEHIRVVLLIHKHAIRLALASLNPHPFLGRFVGAQDAHRAVTAVTLVTNQKVCEAGADSAKHLAHSSLLFHARSEARSSDLENGLSSKPV